MREIILEIDKALQAVPLAAPQGGGDKRHVDGGDGLQRLLAGVRRAPRPRKAQGPRRGQRVGTPWRPRPCIRLSAPM